jgi:hypothetical protein
MSDSMNKLTELKSRIEEAKEAIKAEYTQKLKELSEFMHGLEKHEVHAIVSVSHHHPYYASLGLQYVPVGDIVDKPAKKGKGAQKAAKVKPAATKKTFVFNMSPEKIKEFLAVIKGKMSATEIAKAVGVKNPSLNIKFLLEKKLIKPAGQEGLKKFYTKA